MLACIRFGVYTTRVSSEVPDQQPASNDADVRGGPEPLAAVLRRGFAEWVGPSCPECGLPTLLHGERCDDAACQLCEQERDLEPGTFTPHEHAPSERR